MPNALSDANRLAALLKTGLLDSPPEAVFDRITAIVRRLLDVDVALVSLVDTDRQFFKSSDGLPSPWKEQRQTPLSHSFCQHVVTSDAALIVDDATQHPAVCTNAAITDLGVASYLGMPIHSPEGEVLGSLCAIRTRTSEWTSDDAEALKQCASIVEDTIAMRALAALASSAAHENEVLAREYHHRVKNVMTITMSLLRLEGRNATSVPAMIEAVEGRLHSLSEAHDTLIEESNEIELGALASRLLAPYQDQTRKFSINGPSVLLKFRQITPICLILHELATNSAKYGAIANGNELSVTWSIADGRARLRWQEDSNLKDGAAQGFGTKLLKVAAAQLSGSISVKAGRPFAVEIDFPII